MTNKCVKEVRELKEASDAFDGLSVEQLLFAAIEGSDIEDVTFVLLNTDWKKYMVNQVHYTLEVLPALEPAVRHKIEALLEGEGFEIIGGGQNLDKSGTDISFEK